MAGNRGAKNKRAPGPSAKKQRVDNEAVAQAKALETELFGATDRVAEEVRLAASEQDTGSLHIFEDRGASPERGERAPAWSDPQDKELLVDVASRSRSRKLRESETESVIAGDVYAARLRRQHAKLNPRVSWATGAKAGDGDGSATAALLTQQGSLLAAGGALAPGTLETSRLRDANMADPAQAVIRCLEYHPNGQLLLTAGLDKRVRFFAVDGDENPLVQSLFLEDLPIHNAAFTSGGARVLATGRRKHFYVADLEAARLERVPCLFGVEDKSLESFAASSAPGADIVAFFAKDGVLPLVSMRSRRPVATLKMNGTARTGCFSADGNELYTAGGDGTVYVWDVRQRACRGRFVDEGSLRCTALAVSNAAAGLIATGSSSGVVNLYGQSQLAEGGLGHLRFDELGATRTGPASIVPAQVPKPLRSALNLTTTLDSLAFSPDGQMLALASRMQRDALRVMHVQSGTVFSNWPTSRSPIGYVHSLAFSPSGGSLAIGTAKGRVLVYRLHHYPQP